MLSSFQLHDTTNFSFECLTTSHFGKLSKLSLSKLVYWDVCGLLSYDGHRYLMLCVDHYTRCMWIFPLVAKYDFFYIIKNFVIMVECQFNKKFKHVQTDWDDQVCPVSSYYKIPRHQSSVLCPNTRDQNDIVECSYLHATEIG